MSTEAPPQFPPIDKSGWGDGPWQTEPDRIEFRYAGLPCLMVRHPHFGNWCGYAAVAPGHPAHGKHYGAVDVVVHGGLTYAGHCQGDVCHVPAAGEPDNVFWFGFDCAHGWDFSPGLFARESAAFAGLPEFMAGLHTTSREEVYRDAPYVRGEVERMAEQLAAIRA